MNAYHIVKAITTSQEGHCVPGVKGIGEAERDVLGNNEDKM